MSSERVGERRKALVTGAAGFIGSNLCRRLAERGWDVVGVDNLNHYYDVRLKEARVDRLSKLPNFTFIKADITDRKTMEGLFKTFRPEAVMNLAAQAGVRYSIENPYTYITNNIDGFIVLLECARHWPVKRFIYASSSSVYGSNRKVPFSESDVTDTPVSLYAATKKSNELMARAYRDLYGIPAVGLRFFTVYGPWGRPDMAPMLFAKAIMEGTPIKVFNEGNLSRDFTYIDDIVEGVVRVMEDGHSELLHDLYNIGYGSPVALMDFINTLENALGREAAKEFLPMQKGDVLTTFADTTLLKNDYDYTPYTSLREGIKQFADWYLSPENPLK